MSLSLVHARIADSSALFIAILGIWALVQAIRARALDGNWFGAAVIAELLLIAQVMIGILLYFQGQLGALPRPIIHILYAAVAILTLPAANAYFGNMDDDRVKSLAMFFACLFLWGIVLRASSVAQFLPPGL